MRLINVNTLKLEEFHHKIPPYAILSHTWDNDEVTFEMYQEYLNITNRCRCPGTNARNSNIEKMAGFDKIMGACRRAKEDKLGYLWCDTNCIDKSSSAELTEAINSMYAWYHDSAICYAYLTDVAIFDTTSGGAEEFRKSKWFTRGWTLQELLAPEEILFFNRDWKPIAARRHVADIICGVTRIHKNALLNRDTIPRYSVAQRMSWAAGRKTSRQEDIAYCLLGIFGINMPLLYGEGSKAFTRFQEEIIRVSDDQSILAWDFLDGKHRPFIGILAPSPDMFSSCGSIVREENFERRPYSTTNIGVSLELQMIHTSIQDTVLVQLNCSVELQAFEPHKDTQPFEHAGWRFPVWIWLRSIDDDIYTRSAVPVSRTLLSFSYTDGVDCPPTELYGVTSSSRVDSWVSSIHNSVRRGAAASTGFHVTISFGRIRRQTSTFDQTFSPGDFIVYQIPPRESHALSHEIIVAGNYAVLLSIAWDRYHHQPKFWYHTHFMNLTRATIEQMSAKNWNSLFEAPQRSDYRRTSDVERVYYIHHQVQKLSRLPTTPAEHDGMPFVRMEKELWQDHCGHAKVVVHLTFQEDTRPQDIIPSTTSKPCICA